MLIRNTFWHVLKHFLLLVKFLVKSLRFSKTCFFCNNKVLYEPPNSPSWCIFSTAELRVEGLAQVVEHRMIVRKVVSSNPRMYLRLTQKTKEYSQFESKKYLCRDPYFNKCWCHEKSPNEESPNEKCPKLKKGLRVALPQA